MSPSTKRCSSIFDLGPLTPKIDSPKFGQKSPITRLVWQIDRRCMRLIGGFRGWPIQWNRKKCCGADPCCHGNENLANLGYFFTKIDSSFFVFRWNRAIFGPSVLHVALYKTLFFDFWFRPPNAKYLLPKICTCTKSPITRLVWQIDRRCLRLQGVFGDGRFNGTMQKVVGPTPVAMATKFGLFFDKIAHESCRLVCQIDEICLGLPA